MADGALFAVKSILLNNFSPKYAHPVFRTILSDGPKGVKLNPYLAPRVACWRRSFRNLVLGQPEYDVIPDTSDDAVFSVGILPMTQKPWMASLENYTTFSNNLYYWPLRRASLRRKVLQMIKKDNCYRILPLTDLAGQDLLRYLGDPSLAKKFETLSPAIHDKEVKPIKHDVPTVLFIANNDFYGKGGKEVFAIADRILKKYDAHFIIKSSPVPPEYLEKYGKRKEFTIITERLSDAQIEELYAKSDIFLFPLYTASFGVFLEAKRASLPVITSAHFDMPEIVRDGVDGFVVENPCAFFHPGVENRWTTRAQFNAALPTIKQSAMEETMAKRLATLIEDPQLRRRMGLAGKREIVSGRFSIQHRNAHLSRLYAELTK